MSTPTPIVAPGHILQALSKLLTPFRGKPRFASWCAVPVNQVQTLEDQLWALLALLDVDAADLPRLILLGKIVGQAQRGTLEQFRRYVKVRVLVNRSSGTAPQLIKIAGLLMGGPGADPPAIVNYSEAACAIHIEAVSGVVELDASSTLEFLLLAKMGGVGLRLTASTHNTDGLLFGTVAEATASRTTPDTLHGFADTALTQGGYTAQFR